MNLIKKKGLQCIILCGGKGERLRPLTNHVPKPLVEVNGIPILSHILAHMMKSPVDEFFLCTGYKSKKIESFISNQTFPKPINVIDSGDIDIVKRLAGLKDIITNDFLVLYGDTISDVNVENLIELHNRLDEPATVSIWPLKSQFGIMEIEGDNKVIDYKEKPVLNKWINIGYFYYDNYMIKEMNNFLKYEDFLNYLMSNNKLNAYKHAGVHLTINDIRDLEEAEKAIQK